MKKVIKIVLVVKEEEPKQLQQKLPLEMQKSTMSYGTVSCSVRGRQAAKASISLLHGVIYLYLAVVKSE